MDQNQFVEADRLLAQFAFPETVAEGENVFRSLVIGRPCGASGVGRRNTSKCS